MIYFVRAAGTDYVKIGVTSDDVEKRCRALQVGCPIPLVVEAVIDGDEATEGMLHRMVWVHRATGEWFRLDPSEVRDLIARIPGAIARRDELRRRLAEGMEIGDEVFQGGPGPDQLAHRALVALGRRSLAAIAVMRGLGAESPDLDEAERYAEALRTRRYEPVQPATAPAVPAPEERAARALPFVATRGGVRCDAEVDANGVLVVTLGPA